MGKEQVEVLNALDAAKTQWYHFTAIIIAGMGFFTDAYDLFCISLVTKLLGRIYYHVDGAAKPGSLPPNVSAAVNGVAFVGTLSGQLFFGWLGDKMGRKKVYGMTLALMVIASIASGLSFGHDAKTVMTTLCFFRIWEARGYGWCIRVFIFGTESGPEQSRCRVPCRYWCEEFTACVGCD